MDYFAEKITQFVRKNEEKYCQLSQEIWRYAELAFHEEKSSQALIQMLAQEGFAITTGLAGIPTAFVAKYGSGKPMVGILGEYDALPSLSQRRAALIGKSWCLAVPDTAVGITCWVLVQRRQR